MALREQMTSFYSEALNTAKSSPAQNYSAETLQKISSAVSALGDDKANINKFTYKMIKSIKNAVKGLPDLTRLVNSEGVF